MPFINAGYHKVVGIDVSKEKIKNANNFFENIGNSDKIEFICDDIYNLNFEEIGQFDIIITRDVLEHIHGQEKFMRFVKQFMKHGGKFFVGFPPWCNPFGGHQQICESKILSKAPYFHILPQFLYNFILKLFGESETKIKGLIEIKETRISIERFEKILRDENYNTDKRTFYFINPNYEIKFGMKPRKSSKIISSIPYFRNFFITAGYYLISKKLDS